MGLAPIAPYLNNKAMLYRVISSNKAPSGALTNDKQYDDGEEIKCRFQGKDGLMSLNTADEKTTNAVVYVNNIKINIGDKIIMTGDTKPYFIKEINTLYDYPNINDIHHKELTVGRKIGR